MKTISVVIPVYDNLDVFRKSLHSLFEQIYSDLEIIVVDDGSSTKVSNFLKKEEKKKIDDIIRQENKGAPAARNLGFQNSEGEFVIFWDSDVLAKPDMLSKLKNVLESNQEASYCYCNYKLGWKKMPAQKFDPEQLRQNNYIHTTSLIRSEDMVLWDEDLDRLQDWDLWLTFLEQNKKGVWLDEYSFKLVPNEEGISDWIPSFVYYPPFRWLPGFKTKVKKYHQARKRIQDKHDLVQ